MKTKFIEICAAGMAIFAIFFGAGNIIFPLALGQFALEGTPYALVGLLITAVAMPFMGLLTMFLYQGQIHTFFNRIGRIPGLGLAFFTIALLGPLGCVPRCIALAYSTVKMSFSGISLIGFSLISCALIFLVAFNKGSFLKVVGYFLSPFKILLLVSVIIIGLLNIPEMAVLTNGDSASSLFIHGLKEGYNTMDLLGSFFTAPIIIAAMASQEDVGDGNRVSPFLMKACGIGASLLAIVYVGFCYLAYIYAPELKGVPADQLLGAIALKVLGPAGGIIVSLTVAVTCFTTAVALISAFAGFVQKEILADKVGYVPVILASLVVTFFLTTLEFQGIATFLTPVLQVCYPVLIVLTVYNLIHRLYFGKGTATSESQVPAESIAA